MHVVIYQKEGRNTDTFVTIVTYVIPNIDCVLFCIRKVNMSSYIPLEYVDQFITAI